MDAYRLPMFPLGTPLVPGALLPLQIFEQALAAQYFANDFHSAPLHRAALGRTMRKHPRVASRMHVLGLISDSTYTRYAKCSGFVGIFRSIRHSWSLYDYAQANREAVQSEEVVH